MGKSKNGNLKLDEPTVTQNSGLIQGFHFWIFPCRTFHFQIPLLLPSSSNSP